VILRIDHIGLATGEPDALAPFLDALGMSKVDNGVAAEYRVRCEFWQPRSGEPLIELVSPAGAGSVLDVHLARRGPGLHHIARFLHHATFLLMVGGFIIHVYMSTVMFPGTMAAMTTGRVTRAWAAFHHPAWFRVEDRRRAGADR